MGHEAHRSITASTEVSQRAVAVSGAVLDQGLPTGLLYRARGNV